MSSAVEPLLEARGLVKLYPLPDRSVLRPVLDGVDITLGPGEAVLVSGASGSGKTTLLSILGVLERATRGTLRLFGQDVEPLSAANRTTLRRERIGFGFQTPQLFAALSARENALLPLVPRGLALGPAARRVDRLFDELGMMPLARARAEQLSGGEQQRVALIRALAPQPDLLLLDEPAAHLDAAARQQLSRLLRQALARGAGVLLTSHEGYGLDWVHRHLQMDGGRLHEVPL